ncbi:transposase IS200 family protein [Rhizobium sullae]|uniref:Transposase IS200 family protein n=1 Tax=Rhizobium sullae TaxID=50338 RepID=A0A4R3Q587_RHISU|nr:transposase IS200 family protein [Rhizobium sullae]
MCHPLAWRDVLSERAVAELSRIFAKVCSDFDAELVSCDGEDDHVHLLVNYPPTVQLSKLVNSLKGVSSRLLRQARPDVAGRYFKGRVVVAVIFRRVMRRRRAFGHYPAVCRDPKVARFLPAMKDGVSAPGSDERRFRRARLRPASETRNSGVWSAAGKS